ncbi:MAG: caspase family protein [Cyanobacteria bacterium P01_D01_bin.105]
MCPVSLGTSQSIHTASVKKREAEQSDERAPKLWLLLVGVNHYQDPHLPDLQYSSIDCQGLSEAISEATVAFSDQPTQIHHDNTENKPTLATVERSLQKIVTQARSQDTILFYFSGHGFQDPQHQQAVLCLADTQRDHLLPTGLGLQRLLDALSQCAARQQLVWLDACHSGEMTLRGASSASPTVSLKNPTSQLVSVLRQQASRSSGFYALLSCDQNQRSWEFPELGHGVFTYYLMQGLRGEATNAQGAISADSLYRYVYYQTLRYIDKTNQQLRLINQQRQAKGDTEIQREYPLQTPKRIVEGIGESILVLEAPKAKTLSARRAVLIDGLGTTRSNLSLGLSLSKTLRQKGDFELAYWPRPQTEWSEVRGAIEQALTSVADTVLLYLRGQTRKTASGEAVLVLPEGTQLGRTWLRQLLRSPSVAQQIIVLDCPHSGDLAEWVEELSSERASEQAVASVDHSAGNKELCVLGAASPESSEHTFAQAILDTLAESDPVAGLPVAELITQLQGRLALAKITPHFWLAGKGIIEVLPGAGGKGSAEQAASSDIGICPYQGLRAFGEADAAFFFGRDALAQRLLQAVNHHSFLAVVGASGSGKSSVVQAGLMAQLKQGKRIPGSDHWHIRSMRPGNNPLQTLAQVMTDGGGKTADTFATAKDEKTKDEKTKERLQMEGLLHLGTEGFVQWLRIRPEPIVVLVIDQFEELFTLTSEPERQAFLTLVLGALEHASDRFKLVVTLRSDFMTPCLAVPALAAQLQNMSVLVPPTLSQEDYRQIILRPAEKVGLAVEPELVTVLLQDLNQGVGDLPLLEFVLEQIWEKRQPGHLTLQVYQDEVGGLGGALERKAQAVYDALPPVAQTCARWIFLNLTHLGEGTADTRRRVSKADLVVTKYPESLVEATLQALTAAKLVVVNAEHRSLAAREMARGAREDSVQETVAAYEADESPVTIEVAHEILIRHWSTLRWWLEENRTKLRSQRQVEQATAAWKQNHYKPDFLLRGVPLDAAVELYINNNDELPEEVQRFIESGIEAREAEQQLTQKRLRQAQSAIALISVLALGAIGLGGTAYLQRQQARLQEIEALNALSSAQMANDQYLDATVTAIEAGTQLKSMRTLGILDRQANLVRQQTVGTLQQATTLSTERNRLEGHSQTVGSVVYSPDGQRIASVGLDDTLKIWQADGTLLRSITTAPNSSSYGRGVVFSPNGEWIAIAHTEGQVTLWSLTDTALKQTPNRTPSRSPSRVIEAHSALVTAVAFSPDGTTLATASRDGLIKLWNISNGGLIRTLSGHQGWANTVSWHPDGQQLASGGEDKKLKVWDTASGQMLWEKDSHRVRVSSVDWSQSSEWIAVGEGDRTVKLWNVSDRTALTLGEHETGEGDEGVVQVNSVAFSPDSQHLLSTGDDGTLRVWRIESEAQVAAFKGHRGNVLEADWHPDGHTIASAGSDNEIRLWRLPFSEDITELDLYGLEFLPKNHLLEKQQIAGIRWDGSVEVWNFAVGERAKGVLSGPVKVLPEQGAYVSQIDFLGSLLATANDDSIVRLWDVNQGVLTQSLKGHEDRVAVVQFSPDRSQLLSGSADRTLRLWDVESGEAIGKWIAHDDEVSAIAWHPDHPLIASGAWDGSISIWDNQGNLKQTLPPHGAMVSALAFSPNGQQIVTASADKTIKIWQLRSGDLQHTLTGHQAAVTDIDFANRGRVLLSSGGELKLWNVRTGELLQTVEGIMPESAERLVLSNDGQWLASSSVNGGTRLHTWELNALLQEGCQQIRAYLLSNPTVKEKRICTIAH